MSKRKNEQFYESFIKNSSNHYLKNVCRNKMGKVCIISIILLLIIAYIVPLFYPYDYSVGSASKFSNSSPYLKPFEYSIKEKEMLENGKEVFPHILGTDSLGRDYAIRIMYGIRISLSIAILATCTVTIIGTVYGAISGYFGGKIDLIMMRIVDIIYSLPDMLIIILLSVLTREIFKGEIILKNISTEVISIIIVYSLLYWVGMARIVRGQVLKIKEQEYIQVAKLMGESNKKIILKHIFPNMLTTIITVATLQIPSAIFTESYLSFLGIGISSPIPSLGALTSEARTYLTINGYEYIFVIPSIAIFVIVLIFNLLGSILKK